MFALHNRIKRLALQVLLLLGFYFISRCIFTVINIKEFESLSLFGFLKISVAALRFDLSSIFSINFLYIFLLFVPLWQMHTPLGEKINQAFFILVNSIAFLFDWADWAYFPYNHKRATADVLEIITRKGDFINLLPNFIIDFWFILLGAVFLISIFVAINKKIISYSSFQKSTPIKYIPTISTFVVVTIISILAVRGGVQFVPIGIRNARESVDGKYVAIVINTPFSIISSYQNARLEQEIYFDGKTLKEYINTTKLFSEGTMNKKNVVVVILESFSKEFTGIGGLKSYTPFMDSLMQHSLVCTNAFANGNRSADGIPAILAGIPTMQEEPFTTNIYAVNNITSLSSLLAKQGYSSAFYHGGTNGTMGFDLFAKNASFQYYRGRNEYPIKEDYDGQWGIWDEPYLQYAVKDMSTTLKEPFIASIFTLSSHQPYKVPSKYKNFFPKGDLQIHETIGYADHSLRLFFETAKKQTWFENTLFIFVADHCSPLSNDDYYHYRQGRFSIPLFYFSPSDTSLIGTTDHLTQQIDILPSVMDYLHYPDSFFAFGNSIFSPTKHRFTVQYWSGEILWTMDNYFLHSWGKHPDGLYDVVNDRMCTNNLIHTKDTIANETFDYLKAFRQTYNGAMINNRLQLK